jgi:hypothetical protein
MNLFDLLFIAIFLATVVALLSALVFALRGQSVRCLALLRTCGISLAAYFGIVVLASAFWPRTELKIGERRCYDDWCIAVENAAKPPSGAGLYTVTLRLFSTARGISQREKNLAVYLTDSSGRRYDPIPDPAAVPFDVRLGPQESVTTTRAFQVPAGAGPVGLVIAHESGFPIGSLIIGDEGWFHKPTIVRLG